MQWKNTLPKQQLYYPVDVFSCVELPSISQLHATDVENMGKQSSAAVKSLPLQAFSTYVLTSPGVHRGRI